MLYRLLIILVSAGAACGALSQNAAADPPPRVENCITQERFFPETGGGALPLNPGTQLLIPRGALAASTQISGEACIVYDGSNVDMAYYHFEPSGTQFDPPATLVLHYGNEFEGIEPAACFYWNEEAQVWELINGYHDVQRHRFIFDIDHFSLYAVSANRGEGEVGDLP